jgi:hypothetical protein
VNDNTVIAINFLERDFGVLEGQKLQGVLYILRQFMEDIRTYAGQAETRLGCTQIQRLERCSTCALNPATDGFPGFAPTAYGFLYSILYDKRFLCHGNQPLWPGTDKVDLSRARECAGSMSLYVVFEDESKTLARRAMDALCGVTLKLTAEPQ